MDHIIYRDYIVNRRSFIICSLVRVRKGEAVSASVGRASYFVPERVPAATPG